MILVDDSDDYSEVSWGDFSSEPAMKFSGEYYQNLPINLPRFLGESSREPGFSDFFVHF